MKKLILIFLLLITLPSVLADWFYNSRNVETKIDISSYADIVPLTPSGYIESATINMTFFPKQTDTQELLKFDTSPKAELTDRTLKFTWKKPEGRIDFMLNSNVKTTNTIMEVKQKIDFPILELPEEIKAYTNPSQTIDSNDEDIIRLASDLVKGEDDLYLVVFKIADWTKNNINYNLSTLTAEVSQKASWVLQNKQGVCDELTSLFIALLRSVGIPARFVSGISYTNSELFPEKWGPHGWAEVYFPDYGWLPFDVTYGEFGWIDPTHIKFKDSVDSDEPSTYYQWIGRNADLSTNKLDIKAELLNSAGYSATPIILEASVLKKAVGFGSYNLVEAAIENPNDFYYATELHLNEPKEVKIVGNELKGVLLLPKEKKKVFWIVRLDSDFDRRYYYTFPIIASTVNNITSETSFTSSIRDKYVSLDEVEQTARLLEEEKEKKYSGNVVLSCNATKNEFYEYENTEIHCDVKNIGNVFLENADVCFGSDCRKISLGIAQTKKVTFEINKSVAGYMESAVTLKNEIVSKTSYVNFRINDEPKIEIENLEFPSNVSYSQNFTISFTLAKVSQSNPKNIEVTLALNGIEKKLSINELAENRTFSLSFVGSQLKYGKNDYNMNVDYYDGLNKRYNTNKEFSMSLLNLKFWQRPFLFFSSLENSTLVAILVMGLVSMAVFVSIVVWLFRKR
ncbi:transglutaminase domain-containing protein [Candidatus Woesearchaeota archaeon]|nr:transglutaminase domain-containing protein [Candidatus Woesearchaeota archaeon]